ncbi:MAG TPA: hypothetical protein VEA59_03495 [Patescibacteria group bacterium]|nr:hypothetical protein [Patescibacteria group bacterium]
MCEPNDGYFEFTMAVLRGRAQKPDIPIFRRERTKAEDNVRQTGKQEKPADQNESSPTKRS